MQWENPPKIEWQTTLLQEKHRSCILWFSMQSLCWGCAPPSPQTCQKGPATSPGRPLQTAGFSPQGSRPADGFGGRWPPTAPRSGAGPAGRPTPCKPRDPAADRPPSAGRRAESVEIVLRTIWPAAAFPLTKIQKRRPSHRERRPIFIYSAYSHFFRRKYRTSSTTTATATTMMTG